MHTEMTTTQPSKFMMCPYPFFTLWGFTQLVSRKDTSPALFSCLHCACTAIDDFVPKGAYAGGYALQYVQG